MSLEKRLGVAQIQRLPFLGRNGNKVIVRGAVGLCGGLFPRLSRFDAYAYAGQYRQIRFHVRREIRGRRRRRRMFILTPPFDDAKGGRGASVGRTFDTNHTGRIVLGARRMEIDEIRTVDTDDDHLVSEASVATERVKKLEFGVATRATFPTARERVVVDVDQRASKPGDEPRVPLLGRLGVTRNEGFDVAAVGTIQDPVHTRRT